MPDIMAGGRRPGRPPAPPRLDDEDDTVSVHLKLPARVYDRLYVETSAQRLRSVQELIRLRILSVAAIDDE